MVADTVKGLAGVGDGDGQTGAVGEPAVVGGGTHGGGSIPVCTDTSIAAAGSDLDQAARDCLTQFIMLHCNQRLLIFFLQNHTIIYLPSTNEWAMQGEKT